ncbi:ribonuclease III [Aspergillus cavernicola]|uniref:Ribonuclease III n=1 Tax=Aspergillus cavernicola TaxID=176166 RepID=A0ABR4ISU1_9EURO
MAFSRLPVPSRANAFQVQFNMTFQDEALPSETFRASGVPHRDGNDGNKSLAQIGDTVLQLYLQLEGRARRASRDHISEVTKKVAGNANLTQRGFALGIDAYIHNNPSQGSYISDKLMATTMEAILGAVFLDRGRDLAAVKPVIIALGLTWPE